MSTRKKDHLEKEDGKSNMYQVINIWKKGRFSKFEVEEPVAGLAEDANLGREMMRLTGPASLNFQTDKETDEISFQVKMAELDPTIKDEDKIDLIPGVVYLDARAPKPDTQKFDQQNKKKHPLKNSVDLCFPEPVKWEKVEIKIKEGKRDIEIFYKGKQIIRADYKELGLYSGDRNPKPTPQWHFLCALSIYSKGDFSKATVENLAGTMKTDPHREISEDSIHQHKKILSEQLCRLFKTEETPFFDYKQFGSYRPKFSLLPIPIIRNENVWEVQTKSTDERRIVDPHSPSFSSVDSFEDDSIDGEADEGDDMYEDDGVGGDDEDHDFE
jgi:hypothetical protein